MLAIRRVTIAAMALLIVAGPGSQAYPQTAQSLSQVKRLYVEIDDDGGLVDQLRQTLIKRLRKTGKYEIVDSPALADATLKGTSQMWLKGYITTNSRSPMTNREAVYGGYLSAEVVGKNSETLWSYLVTPGKLIWTSITDDLAASLVKALLAAGMEEDEASAATTPKHNLARTSLSGAGATFPAPLYQKWFQSYQQRNPEVRIAYEAVGSEKGTELLAAGEVDFAASDVSSPDLGDPQLHASVRRIPSVLGAVVPIYNLSGFSQELRFSAEALAGIYLGKITKWNDPEIRRWNKGVDLPDADIVVVHRADGSGTSFTWSDFLSKTSSEWETTVGRGTRPKWPVGKAAEGNAGVADLVKSTANSLGYVELVYAIQHQLNFGAIRNSAGEFVRASLDSVAEAAKSAAGDVYARTPPSITNARAKDAYPVATFTWILLPQETKDSAKRAALVDLLKWMLTDGQKECSALGYAPLPRDVAQRQLESLNASQ